MTQAGRQPLLRATPGCNSCTCVAIAAGLMVPTPDVGATRRLHRAGVPDAVATACASRRDRDGCGQVVGVERPRRAGRGGVEGPDLIRGEPVEHGPFAEPRALLHTRPRADDRADADQLKSQTIAAGSATVPRRGSSTLAALLVDAGYGASSMTALARPSSANSPGRAAAVLGLPDDFLGPSGLRWRRVAPRRTGRRRGPGG
jgi:hypothetical protein